MLMRARVLGTRAPAGWHADRCATETMRPQNAVTFVCDMFMYMRSSVPTLIFVYCDCEVPVSSVVLVRGGGSVVEAEV